MFPLYFAVQTHTNRGGGKHYCLQSRDLHVPLPSADLPLCLLIPPFMFFLHLFLCQSSPEISVSFPDKRSWKQLLANEKCMQRYPIFMYPRPIPFSSVSIFSLRVALWMMCRWHTSQWSTGVWSSFVSDLRGNINAVCAVWDGSTRSVKKSGIFIRVHERWVVGVLMWHWLDVHPNRPVLKTWERSSEITTEEDVEWGKAERDMAG